MKVLVLVLTVLLAAAPAVAQGRKGKVTGTLVNGTSGGPGQAEKVTLFRLAAGMEPIATLGKVSGSFTLGDIDLEEESAYLLQVTFQSVTYNQRIRFDAGRGANAVFTVYDVTPDPTALEVKTARYLLRRQHDRLRVEKLYVVENKTEPRRTFYDPEGTFRFDLPPNVLEMGSVSASGTSGMPVPQPASPHPDGSGYVTKTAFKPGTTDILVSYDVDYSMGSYVLREKAYYPLSKVLILVEPSDIELHADGWEDLSPEPRNRFSVLRRSNVSKGSTIGLELSGGSEHTAERGRPGGEPPSSQTAHGSITTLPDPARSQKWIIALLMGAALVLGLLTALVPRKTQ